MISESNTISNHYENQFCVLKMNIFFPLRSAIFNTLQKKSHINGYKVYNLRNIICKCIYKEPSTEYIWSILFWGYEVELPC